MSSGAGLVLFIIGILVCKAYYPKLKYSENYPAYILSCAIVLGFGASVLNTFYWQILGAYLLNIGVLDLQSFQTVGRFLDLVFKGSAAVAGYLHLKALYIQLNETQKKKWTVLGMAFYPDRRSCVAKLFNYKTKGDKSG
jgi:hypothetical protein